MKISQIFAVSILLVVASVMAFAGPINDPQVIIHGAGNSAVCPVGGCTGVGLDFSFKIPAGGSGTLYFTNDSGQNWNSLTLVEKGVPAVDIKCHSSLFASCTTETLKSGAVEILLSTYADWTNHGIQNGQSFAITFACVKESCWTGGMKIGGYANQSQLLTTPEPGTMALVATGLAGMISRRKLWKNRWNS